MHKQIASFCEYHQLMTELIVNNYYDSAAGGL